MRTAIAAAEFKLLVETESCLRFGKPSPENRKVKNCDNSVLTIRSDDNFCVNQVMAILRSGSGYFRITLLSNRRFDSRRSRVMTRIVIVGLYYKSKIVGFNPG